MTITRNLGFLASQFYYNALSANVMLRFSTVINPLQEEKPVKHRLVSCLAVFMVVCALAPIESNAQRTGKRVNLPGFSIAPVPGEDWSIAVPSDREKALAWFPVSAQEISVPLIGWNIPLKYGIVYSRSRAAREMISRDHVQFTKKLGSDSRLAATIVRASWTTIPFEDGRHLLEAIAQARSEDLKSRSLRGLEVATRLEGDEILPGCLRMDVRFAPASEEQKVVIFTRRYICLHPDVPGYFVEVGYGQQSPGGEQPVTLETETQAFLKSLKFVRQEELLRFPVLQTEFIPVGLVPSQMARQEHTAWVGVGGNWLLQLDTDSGKPTGAVEFEHPVSDVVVGTDAFWFPKDNKIARKVPDTLSTEHLKFIGHLHSDVPAGFAADSIWLPLCDVNPHWVPMGCAGKLARIDVKADKSVAQIKPGSGYAEILDVTGNGERAWVMNSNHTLARIDPASNTIVATISLPVAAASKLFADRNAVWIDSGSAIVRVDAETNIVGILDFKGPAESCVVDNTLWVLEFAGQRDAASGFVRDLRVHKFEAQTLKRSGEGVSLEASEDSAKEAPHSDIHLRACRSDEIWLSHAGGGALFRLKMGPSH
jgi:hypothetical protein